VNVATIEDEPPISVIEFGTGIEICGVTVMGELQPEERVVEYARTSQR
jgi:hypothetical protein